MIGPNTIRICIYTLHALTYKYIHIHALKYIYIHIHALTYIYIYIHIQDTMTPKKIPFEWAQYIYTAHALTYIHIYIHIHTLTYIYIHIHALTYIYIHIHIKDTMTPKKIPFEWAQYIDLRSYSSMDQDLDQDPALMSPMAVIYIHTYIHTYICANTHT